MNEYLAFGRLVGDKTLDPEPQFRIQANSHNEALKKARKESPPWITIVTVDYLGKLNPNYSPEDALRQAIFDERVEEQRYL